jgi:RND family efflux transporter MFP subunit
MKKIVISTIICSLTMPILSCNEDNPQKKLASLVEKRDRLNEEIQVLKKQIEQQDTLKKEKSILVKVHTLEQKAFSHYIDVQGMVKSENDIIISAKVAGNILKIYAREGQPVTRGQLLAEIESDVIQKTLSELKTALELAEVVYEKQKSLWEQQIGTEIQYLQSKNNKESLEKKILSLQAQLEQYKIKATQNGIIDLIYHREGEAVMPGVPLFRIVNNQTGKLKVCIEVAETYSRKVNIGDFVEVLYPDIQFTQKLKVSKISEVINPLSRTFTVECWINENVKGLKPNMIAKVRLRDYYNSSALVLPVNAIQSSLEGEYVFVVVDGKAQKRKIKVATTYGGFAEISEGLAKGEKVIIQGFQELTDGVSVIFN